MFLGKDATVALCTVNTFHKKFVRPNGTMMVRLGRALYGLLESGKRWYDCLSSFLVELGNVQSKTDNCIFSKVSGGDKIMFGLHVDDKFYVSTSLDEFITKLESRFGQVTLHW
jgi:hypothetical protein